MRTRVMRGQEKWTEHTRDLPALCPGTRVLIQNQYGAGKAAKRWDKSGLVLEDLGYNKYRVKVDGSGRVTDRNRQFLKKFTPVTPGMPGPTPTTVNQTPQPRSQQPLHPAPEPEVSQPFVHTGPSTPVPTTPQFEDVTESPASPSYVTPPTSPVQSPDVPEASCPTPKPVTLPTNEPEIGPQLRRSTRIRKPPKRYNPAEYDLS